MFCKGIGISFGGEAKDAARRAAIRALAQNPKPGFAFLFSSISYNQPDLFETIRQELGNIPVFGTTSPTIITNLGLACHWVLLVLITTDGLEFSIQAGKCKENPSEVARYLCNRTCMKIPLFPGTSLPAFC